MWPLTPTQPWAPGPSAWFVELLLATNRGRRQQFIHFKQSWMTPPATYLPQTGVSMYPQQMSPKSPVADSGQLRKGQIPHTSPASDVTKRVTASACDWVATFCPGVNAVTVRGRLKRSHRSSGVVSAADQKQTQLCKGHMCGLIPPKPRDALQLYVCWPGSLRQKVWERKFHTKVKLAASSHIFHLGRDDGVTRRW